MEEFVEKNIQKFHEARLRKLEQTNLKNLLKRKNPYLYRAKNLQTAGDLVSALLDAQLSSSEEEIFGGFLEDLAIFVAGLSLGAKKSSTSGLDLEYAIRGTHYLVSIKSGVNWGNSGQWSDLENNFKRASKVLKQSKHVKHVDCILGVSYGKTKTTIKKGSITQICGQSFWHMISGDPEFYKKIVKPLGHKAKELNTSFISKKSALINRLSAEFITDFCNPTGEIQWEQVVEFNSQNMVAQSTAKKQNH
ncbi:MAG: PmeII family type II restriction endonuclease [Candidatus Micrarchaeota archaeon]